MTPSLLRRPGGLSGGVSKPRPAYGLKIMQEFVAPRRQRVCPQDAEHLLMARLPFIERHDQTLMQRLGKLIDIEGVDDKRALQLLSGTGEI